MLALLRSKTAVFARVAACGALSLLSGCPYGSELEDPGRFALPDGGNTTDTDAGMSGPDLPVDCDWKGTLNAHCAIRFCHGPGDIKYAQLNLTPDNALFARLKDVPPTFLDVEDCDPGPSYVSCTTPAPGCVSFIGKYLVDSKAPDTSFLLTKLTASGCGNPMPLAPGNTDWNDRQKNCFTDMVRAIADLPP